MLCAIPRSLAMGRVVGPFNGQFYARTRRGPRRRVREGNDAIALLFPRCGVRALRRAIDPG
jgi:hypothetical protein